MPRVSYSGTRDLHPLSQKFCQDLEEIVYLLHDRPKGQMVRSSKARSMFASRACRKSVMIGMPLTQPQMKTVSAENVLKKKTDHPHIVQVIRHMGTMNQPWNCPHGRPTMRHLCDMRTINSKSKGYIDFSLFWWFWSWYLYSVNVDRHIIISLGADHDLHNIPEHTWNLSGRAQCMVSVDLVANHQHVLPIFCNLELAIYRPLTSQTSSHCITSM